MKKMSKATKNSGNEPIVFFGSGPVAAHALAMLARDFKIEAVVSKPKPDHHSGDFPVLGLTEKLKLKTFTPATKEELAELFKSKPVKSRVGIVVDYGLIIPGPVIDYFPLGIINSHFSLLPELRGADPITFAILSGQSETGVSLMLIVPKLDEGPILAQAPFHLSADITTPQLTKDLIELSHHLLKAIVPVYLRGEIKPKPQPKDAKATYSRKLTKDDGLIDWRKTAERLEREIRAFLEWPKSRTQLGGKEVIITKAHVIEAKGTPGHTATKDKELMVYCGKGALIIDTLKPAGKPEMSGKAFLAGNKV